MKTNPKVKLLHDVLREGTSAFRQETLDSCLRELRKQRNKRSILPWLSPPLAIAAGFILCASLVFLLFSRRAVERSGRSVTSTAPLKSTLRYPELTIVTSSSQGIGIVSSRNSDGVFVDNASAGHPVEMLEDKELLAFFPDKAAGLMTDSEGKLRLVFLDLEERIL